MPSKFGQGPGPAAYMLPPVLGYKKHDRTRWQSPAYKLGIKLPQHKLCVGPGPKYAIKDYTRFGPPYKPTTTFNSRRFLKGGPPLPGPGAYAPEKHDYRMRKEIPPAWSMGLALRKVRTTFGPGPNAYNLSKKFPPGPAYSLGLRTKTKTMEGSPGPAAYDARNINPIKTRPPMYSMTPRRHTNMTTMGPGPAYNVKYLPGRSAPKFAFGVRRPDHIPPYVLPEDNACVIDRLKPCN